MHINKLEAPKNGLHLTSVLLKALSIPAARSEAAKDGLPQLGSRAKLGQDVTETWAELRHAAELRPLVDPKMSL